jgi:hypothetical protein
LTTARARRARRESWRLALNLSSICILGGVLFLLIGAWIAALGTFAAGLACAAAAAVLMRRRR